MSYESMFYYLTKVFGSITIELSGSQDKFSSSFSLVGRGNPPFLPCIYKQITIKLQSN